VIVCKLNIKHAFKTFSAYYDGEIVQKQHMNSKFHKTYKIVWKEYIDSIVCIALVRWSEAQNISAAESAFVYYGVQQGHSYVSQHRTINITKTLFERMCFYSIPFDVSNKGNPKTFPFAVQYFYFKEIL
jgi:hypothetical protein